MDIKLLKLKNGGKNILNHGNTTLNGGNERKVKNK